MLSSHAVAPLYRESFRPQYHFTPAVNWMNEANGLIFFNGEYHLFYQHNPYNNQWGNMSWGHAVSTNLVHWSHLPVAIPGTNGVMAFTGTVVYDATNSSGFASGGTNPLVAIYTGWDVVTKIQDQRLAFSTDGSARAWTNFSGNPVLDIGSIEFRDPKVFWHEPSQKWVMVVAHGGQKRLNFWHSSDLKNWVHLSEFTWAGAPSSIGGWEVPDMFELPVDGNTNDTRWVLIITPSAGSPAGGNGVLVFIGDFDGTTFTQEPPPAGGLWADYGRDFDGPLTWENMPAGDPRRIWVGIMNSYGESVPTTPWRGAMSIPRALSLTQTTGGVRLIQQPIAELQTLRGTPIAVSNLTVTTSTDPLDPAGIAGEALELEATFNPDTASVFGLDVFEGAGQRTRIGYDVGQAHLFVDRTQSGQTNFNPDAGGLHAAPLALTNGLFRMHVFLDRGTVEVFGNDGEAAISDLVFPDASSTGVSAFATGGNAQLVSLKAYPLHATWPAGPAPVPGSNVVVRWSMVPLPHAIGGQNPVTLDSATAPEEGVALGINDPFYEPDPAIDHLWMFNDLFGGPFVAAAEAPPLGLFVSGQDGGSHAYNAQAIEGVNGSLFLPTDKYGDDLAMTNAFTVELFFRTSGEQSAAGRMQLILEGEGRFRYALIVNEGGAGNVRFAVNDDDGHIRVVDINQVSAVNYADGLWHYLVATYDPSAGAFGEIGLTLVNEDGTEDTASASLEADFQGLPAGSDGNLLLGRHTFSAFADPRTFRGLIDEVRVSRGIQDPSERLGGAQAVGILTLSAAPAEAGVVQGGNAYPVGANVHVAALPRPGYLFSAWDGAFAGQPASFMHAVTGSLTAAANFAMDTGDPDDDGLTTFDEVILYGTNPTNAHSDADALDDGTEVAAGSNPLVSEQPAISYVTNNPQSFNLYTRNQLKDLSVGFPLLELDGESGTFRLSIGLEDSTNLTSWTDVPVPSNNVSVSGGDLDVELPPQPANLEFYRLRSGPSD